jgi:hypothetical protein
MSHDTLKKYGLKRNNPVGKRMGSYIYVHSAYKHLIVPSNILTGAENKALAEGYTCIRYNYKTEEVAFQWCSEFDTVAEPAVDRTVVVRGGKVKTTTSNTDNPLVWHHKWMWVLDDYSGFNVAASKDRSLSWIGKTEKGDSSRIGYRNYWKQFLTNKCLSI